MVRLEALKDRCVLVPAGRILNRYPGTIPTTGGIGARHKSQTEVSMKVYPTKTALIVFLAGVTLTAQRNAQEYPHPTIRVTGSGSISTEPDRARVTMSVSEIRASISQAKSVVDNKVLEIQKTLKKLGVEEKDLNTSQLRIHRMHDNRPRDRESERPPRPRYTVGRQIEVTVTDISKLDGILDVSVELGTNEVWNVSFYSSKEDSLRTEAMKKAAHDARENAEALAAQFDEKIGDLFTAEYSFSGNQPGPYAGVMAGRTESDAFAKGSITLDAVVNAVFKLRE